MTYSDDQIRAALSATVEEHSPLSIMGLRQDFAKPRDSDNYWLPSEVKAVRLILDNLDNSGLQEADADDIRKGDFVRAVREFIDGTTLTVEGVAVYWGADFGGADGWYTEDDVALTVRGTPPSLTLKHETIYRRPAPKPAPDPEVDKLILEDGRLYQAGSDGVYRSLTEAGNLIVSTPGAFDDWDRVKTILDED